MPAKKYVTEAERREAKRLTRQKLLEDPAERAKEQARSARYRAKHPERRRQSQKTYDERNPEKKRKYYEENKERIIAQSLQSQRVRRAERKRQQQQYEEENPEEILAEKELSQQQQIERREAYFKKWYEENSERINQETREERAQNPEKFRRQKKESYLRLQSDTDKQRRREGSRIRYTNNLPHYREQGRIHASKRRARKKGLPSFWLQVHLDFSRQYFKHCCAVCERPLEGFFHGESADHWIPIASDNCPGTIPTNMVPLCYGLDSCNLSKNAKDPKVWLIERYGKRKANAILKHINAYFDIVRDKFPLPEVAHDHSLDDAATLFI